MCFVFDKTKFCLSSELTAEYVLLKIKERLIQMRPSIRIDHPKFFYSLVTVITFLLSLILLFPVLTHYGNKVSFGSEKSCFPLSYQDWKPYVTIVEGPHLRQTVQLHLGNNYVTQKEEGQIVSYDANQSLSFSLTRYVYNKQNEVMNTYCIRSFNTTVGDLLLNRDYDASINYENCLYYDVFDASLFSNSFCSGYLEYEVCILPLDNRGVQLTLLDVDLSLSHEIRVSTSFSYSVFMNFISL